MEFVKRIEDTFQVKNKLNIIWNFIVCFIRKIILIISHFIAGDYHQAKREVTNWKSFKSNPESIQSTYRILDQEQEDMSIFTDEEIQELIRQQQQQKKEDIFYQLIVKKTQFFKKFC